MARCAIYHQENGTGALTIQSNGGEIAVFDFANSQNMGRFITAGAVELYHNGSKKFDTKSDGIDVTGEVQCDSLDVDGNADITGDVSISGGNKTVQTTAGFCKLERQGQITLRFLRTAMSADVLTHQAACPGTTTEGEVTQIIYIAIGRQE